MLTAKTSTARLVRTYLLLTFVAIVWGNAFVAIRYAIRFMTPVELAAARFLPVVLVFGAWLLMRDREGAWQLVRTEWPRVLFMALAGITVYHLALNTGETRVPAGIASLIIALSPSVAAILSALLLHDRLTPLRVGGLVVSFLGLAIVVTAGQDVRFDLADFGYYLLVLLSAVVWGSYSVVGQSVLRRNPQMRVTATVLALAGISMVPLAPPSFWPRLAGLEPSVWVAVGFLSVFCTILAYAIWLSAVDTLGATRVQSFNYLVPFFAVLSGIVLLGERITVGQVIGGVLVVAGVIAVNRRPK